MQLSGHDKSKLQFTVMLVRGDKTITHEIKSARMTIKEDAIELCISDEQELQQIIRSLAGEKGISPGNSDTGSVTCMLEIGFREEPTSISDPKNGNATHRSSRKEYHLTRREKEVLQRIAQAKTNDEIAKELYISKRTVDTHRQNVMIKLDVHNTVALLKVAFELDLVSPTRPQLPRK